MRIIYFAFLLTIVFISCTEKETITITEHTNVIIDDNTAPPYSEITTVQIHNYINKIFIDLYGREPQDSELESFTTFLKTNKLSESSRTEMLTNLMDGSEYFLRLYEITRGQILGVSQDEIAQQIFLYNLLADQAVDQNNYILQQFYLSEADKLVALANAPADYASGVITINEYMRRFANNAVYDEVNMGSENFVLACFENYFKRLPTDIELQASVTIVDGFAAQLLLQDGSSKADFLNIMTTSPGFYEGLVIDIYQQFYTRLPDSEEMANATLDFTNEVSYQDVQRKVMVSDEYAGF